MLYYNALLHLLVYYITSFLMFVEHEMLLFLEQNRKNKIPIHNNFVSIILFSRIVEFELVVEGLNGSPLGRRTITQVCIPSSTVLQVV